MPRQASAAGFAIALLAAAGSAQAEDPDANGVAFSGHYKNTAIHSTTSFGGPEGYSLDVNRLRLEWKGQLRPAVGVEFQYDNEVLLGSYLGTREFALLAALPRRTYWDLESEYVRGGDVLGRHRVRRAAITLSRGATDLRVGRQRIAWGTGRFWSPLDLLNRVSPTALEPGEREGVDALLLEHKRSAVSRLSFVYAPVRGERDFALAQWHANTSGLDYSVTAGQVREGYVLGLDVAGQLGGAGIRGEWTVTRQNTGGTPQRLLLGWDYAFANTLTLTAELYFDGSGTRDAARYDVAGLLLGRRQNLGRRYAGFYARYEFTPLLKWETWLASNLDDRSRYVSPRLTYSVRQNLDLAAGGQLYGGHRSSEFGQRKDLWFAYAQWFF